MAKIDGSVMMNTSLAETLGPCGRQIVNRRHRKQRDNSKASGTLCIARTGDIRNMYKVLVGKSWKI
jgi:hypothetical protein